MADMNETPRDEVLWLRLMMLAGEIGPARLRALLDKFPDPEGLFAAGRRACADLIGEEVSRRLFSDQNEEDARATLVWRDRTDKASLVTWTDADFPRRLMAFAGAPSLFLLRGRRELLAGECVALAGSDRPDAEGRENAAAFAASLVRRGISPVTLLENETDAAAARAALEQKRPDAGLIVLSSTGPDRLYPSGMRDLFYRAAEEGLILTPFVPGTGVCEETLEKRRVTLCWLCAKLLVVQAELPSRAHCLARLFAENNRDVFAVPGSIHNALYKGNHKLIREGARLTETVDDVIGF